MSSDSFGVLWNDNTVEQAVTHNYRGAEEQSQADSSELKSIG